MYVKTSMIVIFRLVIRGTNKRAIITIKLIPINNLKKILPCTSSSRVVLAKKYPTGNAVIKIIIESSIVMNCIIFLRIVCLKVL